MSGKGRGIPCAGYEPDSLKFSLPCLSPGNNTLLNLQFNVVIQLQGQETRGV